MGMTPRVRSLACALLLVSWGAACTERSPTPATDASDRQDAGDADAAQRDAALAIDASEPDSARRDAGAVPDAFAGEADAMPTSDASEPDAAPEVDGGKPVFCHGLRDCINGSVYECAARGTAAKLVERCAASELCRKSDDSGDDAACGPLCEPGAALCSGNLLTTCNATGTGPTAGGSDCTLSGKVCNASAAVCTPKICEPHTSYCKDGDVYRCLGTGATEMLFANCYDGGEFCAAYASSAYCLPVVCSTPGQPLCDGSRATTCAPDGSYAPGGTDCAAIPDQVCRAGACVPVICEPYQYGCIGDAVNWCSSDGTEWVPYDTCSPSEHCASARCTRDVCVQGQPGCAGNRVSVCNANGSSFEPGGTDCAMLGEVCDATVQCAFQAVDIVGMLSGISVGWHGISNVYDVRSDRHLIMIAMDFDLQGASSIDWFVYESSDGSNYTKIFQLTVPFTGDGSVVLRSSGTISVSLQAGRRYIIGMHSAGNITSGSHDYVETHDLLSFGEHVGAENLYELPATYFRELTWDGHFMQQLTTAP